MKSPGPRIVAAAALAACVVLGSVNAEESVNRSFAFETDKWFTIEATEGPVTLHRIQIARQGGTFTKSNLFRPGNSEYLASIEIRLEYSNTATHDWKGRFRLALLDEAGREIDGYNGTEDLDEGENHEIATVKLSTLKYALDVARKLRVGVDLRPE